MCWCAGVITIPPCFHFRHTPLVQEIIHSIMLHMLVTVLCRKILNMKWFSQNSWCAQESEANTLIVGMDWIYSIKFSRFTIQCTTSDWLRTGQNSHCIMGKCQEINVAQYKIIHEYVSNDLKMWIKWLHTEIHNMITIYIHNRSIYCQIFTCTWLNHFKCLCV